MSQVTNATFLKMPHNWNLASNTKYSSQYSGGGDQALIDGIRGTTNFSSGAWQGYQGRDLVAVVDLGQTQSVSKLGAGFLQDVGSWILMPVRVDFEVSTDGVNFVQVLSIANSVSNQNYETLIKISLALFHCMVSTSECTREILENYLTGMRVQVTPDICMKFN